MGNPTKLTPARASYPKTNYKRFMEEWDTRMGGWVHKAEKRGNHIMKREGTREGQQIFDEITDVKDLVSTMVVTGGDDDKGGDFTFDIYNQTSEEQTNEFRIQPAQMKYVDRWEWAPLRKDNLHHSDQRNDFTTEKPRKNMANARKRDGQTLQDIMSSKRR